MHIKSAIVRIFNIQKFYFKKKSIFLNLHSLKSEIEVRADQVFQQLLSSFSPQSKVQEAH